MAASFFAVVIGVAYLQFGSQSDPEQVLLSHVDHELHVDELKPGHLQHVMYSVNAQASDLPGEVIYASNCVIDGELVAHIVVRDKAHELTLLLIPQPMLNHEVTVQNARWRGVIKPHAMGNIAVLSGTDYPGNVESDAIRYSQAIKRRTI